MLLDAAETGRKLRVADGRICSDAAGTQIDSPSRVTDILGLVKVVGLSLNEPKPIACRTSAGPGDRFIK
jgi:hypothetical protein